MIKKIIAYIILAVLITSCVAPVYVTNITSYGSLKNTEKKTATVVGLDRVFVNDYEKTFDKNFSSTLEFSQKVTEEFASALVANSYIGEAVVDFSPGWKHIHNMTSKQSYLTVSALFDECTTDYLICLDDFKIERIVELNDTNNFSSDMSNTTTSSEFVLVLGKVKIYDVKTHEVIIEFDALGEDQVFFFSYTKSMEDAKMKFINNTINFLKTGEK